MQLAINQSGSSQVSLWRCSGLVETTPTVVDGVMYITEPTGTVTALDNPISYGVGDKQHIAVAAGNAIYTFNTPC